MAIAPSHRTPRRLAFVSVCTRGSGITVYDYADFGEALLGWRRPLFICTPAPSTKGHNDPLYIRIVQAMVSRFGAENVVQLPSWPPAPARLDEEVRRHNITDVFLEKSGLRDGVLTRVHGVRNLVHATVYGTQPHGDVYARVGSSIGGHGPIVPPVVRPPPAGSSTLRGPNAIRGVCEWSRGACPTIPHDATVFCRHGGAQQFNIGWAREAVVEVANRSVSDGTKIYFAFLTTSACASSFCLCAPHNCPHERVILLPPETDKHTFIRTCDAMLHARKEGETFGLAIGEFAVANKPIITANFSRRIDQTKLEHHAILGATGVYYRNKSALIQILLDFDRTDAIRHDWRAYTQFEPRATMRRFDEVYLQSGGSGGGQPSSADAIMTHMSRLT